jgi:AcrR family transcriptional regulator
LTPLSSSGGYRGAVEMDAVGTRSSGALRADAARNVAQIRAAAIDAFHGRGLSTPMEQIAAAAGVSKGTIYARFGGRAGLIDAVIGEVVTAQLNSVIDRARELDDPWSRFSSYVAGRRDLLYREPAFTDALLMSHPDSPELVRLAESASAATDVIVADARSSGVLRPDFTANDLYFADLSTGLALQTIARPSRGDYDRRTRFFLDGLRA